MTEHARSLSDAIRDGRVMEGGGEERDVNCGVAQRQAAHIGTNVQDARPGLGVEKIDGDHVRIAKKACGPAASGPDVDDDRSPGAPPSARQEGGGSGRRLETPAPQSRIAAIRVLSTVCAGPAFFLAEGGVLGRETFGRVALQVSEQVEAASNRDDRSTAAWALGHIRFWRRPALRASEELIELAQLPQRRTAGTQPNRERAIGPAPDAMTCALTSTAR